MLALRKQGVRELWPSSSLSSLLIRYSSSSQPNFMVDYLVNSLGLSKEEAISASTKVSHLKSTKNPDLVLNYFKQWGLNQNQIRNLISSSPDLLLRKVDETLKPKIKIFQDLGFTRSDLVKLLSKSSLPLDRGLESHIIPTIDYLRQVFGSDEKVIKAINTCDWFISSNILKRMPPNLSLLRSSGFSDERIEKLLMRYPRVIMKKHKVLEDAMHRAEFEFGISRDSAMFMHSISVLSFVSKSHLEKRFAIFRSFGWSDSDVYKIFKVLPLCLSLSEAKIRKGLVFFMNELGYTSAYVASHPVLLSSSFEKRVHPRNEVLKILKEKKLVTNVSLYTAVCWSELTFVENFVLRYKDEIPYLYETYTSSMNQKCE